QVGHPLVARIGSCRGAGGRAAEGAMMLTVDEARRALERFFEQNRPLSPGTLYIAPQAWADDRHYGLKWGSREWLVGRREPYRRRDNLVLFVSKRNGMVTSGLHTDNIEKLRAMTPVKGTEE